MHIHIHGTYMDCSIVHITPAWWKIWSSGCSLCSEPLPGLPWIFPPDRHNSCPQEELPPGRMLLVQPVQAGDSKSACESLRGEKQLCSINQSVVMEQCDPSKAGQGTAGAAGSSPRLVLVWLCKDLLGWMSFIHRLPGAALQE